MTLRWPEPPSLDSAVGTRGFVIYVAIGGAIGFAASIALFAIGLTSQLSTPAYALAVLLIYAVGVAISYLAHSAITFKAGRNPAGAMKHTLVCGTSGLAVSALAALFRTALSEANWNPALNGMVAFVAASLIVSAASYWASRSWVFSDPTTHGSH